ncbi:MAG: VCBS repeat-containing protein [Pyrinomonadaceae bacterium]|nr:VCBS repeat-containing protein [Acidobacteriota bacterium]MBK7932787.1 VCBS repeat-containing protein [Acidobacteriota bacterium]MBP7375000.1 VCBS repeat-containing protein [Pyrinomonadaceae bacterium]
MNFRSFRTILSGLLLFVMTGGAWAAPVVRQGTGANTAALQAIVDQFRADLGGANNGVGGLFTSGRREINWDGVPDSFSEPNNLPLDFFNVNSPRGVIFNAIEDATGAALNQFAVSATTASGVPVRFANINATYSSIFTTFSAQRLFTVRNTNIMEVNFVIPGTNTPATVSGFGVIFADVDSATGGNRSLIRVYGTDGRQLSAASAGVLDNGLSFVGISFNAGERIARVVIESGNAALSSTNNDGVSGVDVVAMDDFIYGEPRASQFHSGDFDGDGISDSAIFRPSSGTWFRINSGSNTVSQENFGLPGDIPLDGDFDGDSRADVAIFRPSNGEWYFRRSSNSSVYGAQFGQNGDKPVVGDYDKDGKSDIALWRPSNGNFFVLRSSTDFTTFFGYPFGVNGDIPVQGGAQ